MKKFFAMMLALVMALSLAACGKQNDANSDGDNNAEPAKTTLVVGVSADYAPFEFMYPDESGELVYGGIDISVAQYVADELGLTLQVENMSFDNLLTSLDKGDFDMVLSAMEATPDRLENADFSNGYYSDTPPAILVKAEGWQRRTAPPHRRPPGWRPPCHTPARSPGPARRTGPRGSRPRWC